MNETGINYQDFNAWKQGDTVLDWDGYESGQGFYFDVATGNYYAPYGTPTVRTSNEPNSDEYSHLNMYVPY